MRSKCALCARATFAHSSPDLRCLRAALSSPYSQAAVSNSDSASIPSEMRAQASGYLPRLWGRGMAAGVPAMRGSALTISCWLPR